VRIYDADIGDYVGGDVNCSFWVTEDGTNYSVVLNTTSNTDGYCAVFYTPDCNTSVGPQKWVGGVFNDECYDSENSTEGSWTALGSLKVTILSPANETSVGKWQTLWFNSTVNDSLCDYYVNDGSVTWYNESDDVLATGYNTTWTVPGDYKTGPTYIRAYASRQYYNPGTSEEITLYIYSWSYVGEMEPPNGSTYLAGDIVPVSCMVRDASSGQGIYNYEVKFYKDGVWQFTDYTDETGKASWAWDTSDESAGYYNISCNITDDDAKYYFASENNTNFTIVRIKRPLILTDIIVEPSTIYRNDSFAPYQANITVHVNDANVGDAENATVWFYNQSGYLFDNCTTNATGWCTGIYNPQDDILPGVYTIYINATKSGQDPSSTNTTQVTVKGKIFITITSPEENSTWSKEDTIPLTAQVKDENNQQVSATVEWFDQFNQKIAEGVSTTWNPKDAIPGYQNISAKATRTYYDTGEDVVWITINSIADVYMYEPIDGNVYPYPDNITIRCKVEDSYSFEGIANYTVDIWYNRTPTEIYHIVTLNTSADGFVQYNWTPDDKGNTTFMCNITDDPAKYYEAGKKEDSVMVWVKDTRPPWFEDPLITPNQSIEANKDQVKINVTVWDNYGIQEVKAIIGLPNGSFENLTMGYLGTWPNKTGAYQVFYAPYMDGEHNVTIWAMDRAPENNTNTTFAGYFYVWGKTYGKVTQLSYIEVPNITQEDSFSFDLVINFTNIGFITAYNTVLNVTESTGYVVFNTTTRNCGDVGVNESCVWPVRVTVLEGTPHMLIEVYGYAKWDNADGTTGITYNITRINVASNPEIRIRTPLDLTIWHGNSTTQAIIVESYGNDYVKDINLLVEGGDLSVGCPGCTVDFDPEVWGVLDAGKNFTSLVTINIPYGQAPGFYWTYTAANTSNAGVNYQWLNITIPVDMNWTISPTDFGTVLLPVNTSGRLGQLNLTNVGNVKMWYHVYRSENGSQFVSEIKPDYLSAEPTASRLINLSYIAPIDATRGMYLLEIRVEENSTFATKTAYMWLNVSNPPPTIQNFTLSSHFIENGYENLTISANVTDNLAVSLVWTNITDPDNYTIQTFLNGTNDIYTQTFSPNKTGNYTILLCANDTENVVGCVSDIFEVVDVTNITIISYSDTVITGVTAYESRNATVLFTINNTGHARGFYVNVTFGLPENWTATPDVFYYGTVLRGTSISNTTVITVPAGTSDGNYTVNLTVTWTNINGSVWNDTTTIIFEIKPYPILEIYEDVINVFANGLTVNQTFHINSTGSEPLNNITFTCLTGDVCNFSPAFYPSLIPQLNVTESMEVNLSVSPTPHHPIGTVTGYIEARSAEDAYDVALVNVTVAPNWEHNTSWMYKKVAQGNSGTVGWVTVNNTGAPDLVLLVNTSEYLSSDVSSLFIPYNGTGQVEVLYHAPETTVRANHTQYLFTFNSSGMPQQKNTTVILEVVPLIVNITSPTENNPLVNVSSGDLIYFYVKVQYGTNDITDAADINFHVRIGNRWLSEDEYLGASYSSGRWRLVISAPTMKENKGYDIEVKVDYLPDNVTKSDVEGKAVLYKDTVPPVVKALAIPDKLTSGQSVLIQANITEEGAVKEARVSITRPDGSELSNLLMNYVGREGDVYYYEYYLDGSWVNQNGSYVAEIIAEDYAGMEGVGYAYFDAIESTVWFGGFLVDIEHNNQPIPGWVDLYRNKTNSVMYHLTTNESTGEFGDYVAVRAYDIDVKLEGYRAMILRDTMIDQGYADPFIVGLIDKESVGSGAGVVTAFAFNTSQLVYPNATIWFNYSNLSLGDVSPIYLGIYECRRWLFGNNTCKENDWRRLNSHIDFAQEIVWADREFVGGAYALAQYVCGNQQCELEFAESAANCPTDCPLVGGGGAGGAGEEAAPAEEEEEVTVAPAPAPAPPPAGYVLGGGGGGITAETVRPASALISKNSIELELEIGEYKIVSLDITNNKDTAMRVNAYVEGDIWQFIQIANPTFSIPPKSGAALKMKYYTLPTSNIGIYTGDIVLRLDNEERRVATTLKVVPVKEALLDVKVTVLTPEVRPGGKLKFTTQLFNLGNTKRVDVWLNYTIREVETGRIIKSSEETRAITTTLEISKEEEIPEDVEAGLYVIEAVAHYSGKIASSLDTFKVVITSPILAFLYTAFTSIWVYIGIIVIILLGRNFYRAWKERREKAARYVFPIDLDKVPKAGPDTIWLGKIAERDAKAYLEINQLMMHGIAAGATGAGKTVSVMVIAEELLKKGIPVIVFDPTLQWTGFIKPCKDDHMLKRYPMFGMRREQATGFKVNIIDASSEEFEFDIRKHWDKPEMTIFAINRLPPEKLDDFVRKTIDSIFKLSLPESKKLKVLIVYDEVHRLLPKYGGKGGYVALERGAREFRKWGIGLFMLSQVLMDFRGAIRANIGTEIQLRTKYEGDINRVKQKYGSHYASLIPKLETGTGLFQNPEYNNGKPYFIQFRPLLHDTSRLTDEEINTYYKIKKRIEEIEERVKKLKEKGVDTYDIEVELNLAKDRLKEGSFNMATAYLDSVDTRLKKLGA